MHRQAADLQGLVALALNEASTIQHVMTLEQVSIKAQAQLLSAEQTQAEQELIRLHRIGQDTLERIRALEDSGVTLDAQKAQLEREAEVAREHIADLEASASRDEQEIAEMERQAGVLRAQTANLEAAALRTQEKIARLRRQLEEQHRANEQEAQRQRDN